MSQELELRFDIINREYISQMVRSSGSVGANYIEASDSLEKADALMKLKISSAIINKLRCS